MSHATIPETRSLTLADLMEQFGPMPAHRIRNDPPPGTATEEDWHRVHEVNDRLYELVDGILLEKDMGYREARLAAVLIHLLGSFLDEHNLGIIVGADGASRFMPGLIRIPDVSFVSWDRLPNRKVPKAPLPDLVPDFAIEVLSRGNTKKEMDRKLKDYFETGVRLVWYVDPPVQTVRVHTSPEECIVVDAKGTLDGGNVLPGFTLAVRELFARADCEQ